MTVDRPFRVAAIEFNPELFEFDRNLTRALEVISEAAGAGARLIVLPECALSGYIYRDRDQFLPYMDAVPGRATDRIAELTRRFSCYVAIGIAEADPDTGLTYNTGALIGPDGYIGKYRKNGLNPSDNLWFVPGDTGYPVFETELGRICMLICYDDTYWEPARLAALKGADLIAYICASDRVLPQLTEAARNNHSTIAAVEQFCAWNGLAMVATDRNNAETNPTTGLSVTFGGAASIWQATGERTGHLPATTPDTTAAERPDPVRHDRSGPVPQRAEAHPRRPASRAVRRPARIPVADRSGGIGPVAPSAGHGAAVPDRPRRLRRERAHRRGAVARLRPGRTGHRPRRPAGVLLHRGPGAARRRVGGGPRREPGRPHRPGAVGLRGPLRLPRGSAATSSPRAASSSTPPSSSDRTAP
ncbi:nitrilase-related carbon-nitrogen hydrolase [Gordonia caeni]|uniref:CN hydrolase domain-containing protein n=1 Tax=Gordonia caeni TaxID=1007097 RepID=A0ABP7NV42_9ACTN